MLLVQAYPGMLPEADIWADIGFTLIYEDTVMPAFCHSLSCKALPGADDARFQVLYENHSFTNIYIRN